MKSKKFLIGLAVAAVLPLSFYLVAKVMSKDKIFLPNYYVLERIDTVSENGDVYHDSIFHTVADVSLINQMGKPVSINKDFGDKIVVVNFFFTHCPTVCPKLTGHMKMLQRAFKKNDTTVHLVSITVDPQNDSFQAIRAYADAYNADHDHWTFLTGDKNVIFNYARNELHVVSGAEGEGADELLHTQKLVLLDKDRHIRGYYDGLDTAELRRCADDIILLTLEKKRKRRSR